MTLTQTECEYVDNEDDTGILKMNVGNKDNEDKTRKSPDHEPMNVDKNVHTESKMEKKDEDEKSETSNMDKKEEDEEKSDVDGTGKSPQQKQ